jgi:hypothetical protein
MAAFPLPFLTSGFINNALTGDDASFRAAIALLNAQTHIPVNANSGLLLLKIVSPITFALYPRPNVQEERTAVLIEALYTHCGISTTPWVEEEKWANLINSPLWIAMKSLNFPAAQTLLRCNADFDAGDGRTTYHQHTILHVLASCGDEAVKFLTLLPNNNPLLNPNLNGNRNGDTALHMAVVSKKISPGVVRLLIDKFGADPTIRNGYGAIPLDTLQEMAKNYRRFYRDRDISSFEERVVKTEQLLTRTDRALAVLMGVSLETRNQESELRYMDKELAAMILDLADQ